MGAPPLDVSERGGEDMRVGAPRLHAVRAWGMHRHNITSEWDMRAQVNV